MPKRIRTITPQISELADRLTRDIGDRKLAAGDRYYSAAEASSFLGVSTRAANLALQLLEKRQIISRQQRRGAFVLDVPDGAEHLLLHRVHFLVHPLYLRTEGIGSDMLLIGMQRELPGVHVQISFLPPGDEVTLVQQLIAQALGAETTDGFIMVRASCETQRLVSSCGLPAVVYGAVYPGIESLPSLNRDMWAGGKLLADWLIERGHSNYAYLGRQILYPGDHLTMDAIIASLDAAGFSSGAIRHRGLPTDPQSTIATIQALLEGNCPPTALICRTYRMAEAAEVAIQRLGKRLSDFDIVVCDYYGSDTTPCRFPYPKPVKTAEQLGEHLASLLLTQLSGSKEETCHEVVPVELELPHH